MTVKLAGRLPKGIADGLSPLTDDLRAHQQQIIVVALLEPSQLVDRLDDDEDPYQVVMKVVAVEMMTDSDAMDASKMLHRQHEIRTGRRPLPLDQED